MALSEQRLREIIREELADAIRDVRIARQVREALIYGGEEDNISIFIIKGSTFAKRRKLWDNAHSLTTRDPLKAIIEAVETARALEVTEPE